MDYNSDFQYDLKFGQEGETEIAALLNDCNVEVFQNFVLNILLLSLILSSYFSRLHQF